MNTSQFMDKQIMDLSNSNSHSSNDFLDLMEGHLAAGGGGGSKKEQILPNYDFQPIRPLGTSSPPRHQQQQQNHRYQVSDYDSGNVGGGGGGGRVWNSADSKANSGIRNYGSLDTVEPVKVIPEKDRSIYDAALLSEIDRTMKKHADNLLHALEGVSARLTQLETRSRHLENSVDDLKVSVGNNYGSTDGKMRQIENILREVQADVQVVKDKQEILEAQIQLSKLQVSKTELKSESQTTGHLESAPIQQVASAPMQSYHQFPPAHSQPPPNFPAPNAPPPQNLPPPLPTQFPPNQIPSMPQHDPYYLPPGQSQTPETPNQQYQVPPPQQIPPPLPAQPQTQQPPQYHPPPPPPQYSQPPPPPQQHPSQPQLPVNHHSEEPPFMPSQSYPPIIRQSSGPPAQQFYGAPPMMYDQQPPPPSSRPSSGFSYGSSTGHNESFSYGGPQPQYNVGSPRKSQQISPPNMGPSSGNGYQHLPTARILPQALPTASAVGAGGGGSGSGSGSGSGGSGNRVPIDDVVDKVTSMGFSREQVRATVKKLTENGQSVDLNIVLDKLMNDGVEAGPPRGWLGR